MNIPDKVINRLTLYHFILDNLREDEQYISSTKIAQLLNIHQSTYSDYESGNLNLPVEALVTLANFYNTSTDYLLGLTDKTTPYPKSDIKP